MYNLIKRALVTIDEKEKYPFAREKDLSGSSQEESTDFAPEAQADPPEVNLAKEKARSILQQAREEAEKILAEAHSFFSDAQTKANEIIHQSHDEVKKHKQDVQTQLEKAMETSFKAMESVIRTLETDRNKYVEMAAQELAQIVSVVCHKVLSREISGNEQEVILWKIKQVMQRISNFRKTVFRLHPDDFEKFPKEEIEKVRSSLNHVEFRLDSSLSKGSVVIDTDYGTLDSSIDSQLNILDELVSEIVGSGDSD